MDLNTFGALDTLVTPYGKYAIHRLDKLERDGLVQLNRLPYSIRVLLEALLRQCNGVDITTQDVINLARWEANADNRPSMPFKPARVIMQDFTGVPAVVDLAAMRSAVARLGGDPRRINPSVPVDLVIDHSVQVDFTATKDALNRNAELEFQRNRERYEFLHWGQKSFDNFRVVPPATGIVHQVNLEYLATVVMTSLAGKTLSAYPDTLVGTDSHTTMINGLGVVGWGVGGIEAEAAMLGQAIDMLTPDVIGFKFLGQVPEGVTATDITLMVTQMLRNHGVVDKFVEFFGPGLNSLSLADRATIANMAPEYGATIGFFPVDDETINYLRLTGRADDAVSLVEAYCKEQKLFRSTDSPDPEYTNILELDLSSVEPNLAGPKRPQDRVKLSEMRESFQTILRTPVAERGYGLGQEDLTNKGSIGSNGSISEVSHGAVVIAAITSCTNTSNPSVMVAAGLLAKKAVDRGLKTKPYVKTSLAPGSRVVTEYLTSAGLLEPLAELGFNVVGYGCTTCIGNSGPLSSEVIKAITGSDIVSAAVISGNRNFEGRVHSFVRANYLASPPLVVAYALAGTVDIDLIKEPLGIDKNGEEVYLQDIWPTSQEVGDTVTKSLTPEMYRSKYADVFSGNETWNLIEGDQADLYNWSEDSTYIQEPPFFMDLTPETPPIKDIKDARVLAVLDDSITTDHISPAGSIAPDSPAGQYLIEQGIQSRNFNSYGSRRGNDRVMTRGTFANIRLKNQMVPGIEGGWTIYLSDHPDHGNKISIYDAAVKYKQDGVPLVVLAGKEYGTGSSRDWAAKGTILLGVKAVIAESFERIHRSNLIGMGVLPLQFQPGDSVLTLGLTGHEVLSIEGLTDDLQPQDEVTVHAVRQDGSEIRFNVIVRLNTEIEVDYYRNGGILHSVLRGML